MCLLVACLLACLCLCVCVFVCLRVCLFVCLLVGWLVGLLVCLFACLLVCLFACLVFQEDPLGLPPFWAAAISWRPKSMLNETQSNFAVCPHFSLTQKAPFGHVSHRKCQACGLLRFQITQAMTRPRWTKSFLGGRPDKRTTRLPTWGPCFKNRALKMGRCPFGLPLNQRPTVVPTKTRANPLGQSDLAICWTSLGCRRTSFQGPQKQILARIWHQACVAIHRSLSLAYDSPAAALCRMTGYDSRSSKKPVLLIGSLPLQSGLRLKGDTPLLINQGFVKISGARKNSRFDKHPQQICQRTQTTALRIGRIWCASWPCQTLANEGDFQIRF